MGKIQSVVKMPILPMQLYIKMRLEGSERKDRVLQSRVCLVFSNKINLRIAKDRFEAIEKNPSNGKLSSD